jgi:hypothetical protein
LKDNPVAALSGQSKSGSPADGATPLSVDPEDPVEAEKAVEALTRKPEAGGKKGSGKRAAAK